MITGLKTFAFGATVLALIACSDSVRLNNNVDPIVSDPVSIDKNYPPKTVELDFDSHGSALNGHFYLAAGQGAHPTVILLHGFPGYEKNLDIAQAIRRSGFNVLFFHYRGAWGSAGDFSLSHVIEDTLAASAFVRDEKMQAAYNIDPEHISFLGHSMGGFAALAAGAQDENVRCIGAISAADYGLRGQMFSGKPDAATQGFIDYIDAKHLRGAGPLRGISGKAFLAELAANKEAFSVSKMAAQFAGRSVLLTAAKDDTVLPPSVYHAALTQAFEAQSDVRLTQVLLEGDHSYSWTRMALTRAVVDWLNEACR